MPKLLVEVSNGPDLQPDFYLFPSIEAVTASLHITYGPKASGFASRTEPKAFYIYSDGKDPSGPDWDIKVVNLAAVPVHTAPTHF